MKKITQIHEHLINKRCVIKNLILILTLCIAFNVNAQFRLVKDVSGQPLNPHGFVVSGGNMFFIGVVPGYIANCLYRTDGTTIGTFQVELDSQIANDWMWNPDPSSFFEYNSEYYGLGLSQTTGNWLFKVSGSSNQAVGVYNLFSRSFTNPLFFNGEMLHSARNEPFNDTELLKLNLTTGVSLVRDIWYTSQGSSYPAELTFFDGRVLFSANGGTHGREIWETDGTLAGTVLYLDVNTGATAGNPNQFNIVGSNLTFVSNHATVGRELFKTNGSGSLGLIRNIHPTGDSNPSNVTLINGTLYFSADNGTNGVELWKSDGNTSLGTVIIKDINPTGDSNPSKFFQFGTDIYFIADDGTNGIELWKTNGTSAGTSLVKNINPTGSSNPDFFTEYNGKLYFTANDGVNGTELWVTDGTNAGTSIIELDSNGDAAVSNLIVFNNELYFSGDESVSGVDKGLWAYQDPALSINKFKSLETSISLFPNPSNNHFKIETKETLDKVEIYSLQGQSVKSFVPQTQYDISDLSNGVYFVKIQANNYKITKRIVKQ